MSDEYWTPDDLYHDIVRRIWGVPCHVDFAATPANSKCGSYMDKDMDALKQNWTADGWLNPPNSQLKAFLLKAFEEWKKYRRNIVVLCPMDVFTRRYTEPIWARIRNGQVKLQPIYKRPSFLLEGKESPSTSRQGYCTLLFPGKGYKARP